MTMIVSVVAKNIFDIIQLVIMIKKKKKHPEVGAEDMVQQFRLLAALVEDMGSIPSTYMAI